MPAIAAGMEAIIKYIINRPSSCCSWFAFFWMIAINDTVKRNNNGKKYNIKAINDPT